MDVIAIAILMVFEREYKDLLMGKTLHLFAISCMIIPVKP